MQIHFTDSAASRINEVLKRSAGGVLKLAYDSEGCGCSVSGVPTLWIVDQPAAHDALHAGEPFELWVDKKQEIFFEEKMTVDYVPEGLRFVLKSSGQIYNAYMNLADKRAAVASV